MTLIFGVALILGLIGLAVHALWIVVVIILALGLGYVAAQSRRNRADVVNQRQEDELDTARETRKSYYAGVPGRATPSRIPDGGGGPTGPAGIVNRQAGG